MTMMIRVNKQKKINKVLKFLFNLFILFFLILVAQIPKPDLPTKKDEQKGILFHLVKFIYFFF